LENKLHLERNLPQDNHPIFEKNFISIRIIPLLIDYGLRTEINILEKRNMSKAQKYREKGNAIYLTININGPQEEVFKRLEEAFS